MNVGLGVAPYNDIARDNGANQFVFWRGVIHFRLAHINNVEPTP